MIPLHRPYVGPEELIEIKKVIDSKWLTQGPKVKEFEESVKDYLGIDYAIACSSCTTALHLSLNVAGVGPGDSVLVADYTYPATAHAIMYCGAEPIFIDVDPFTYNIDFQLIENSILPNTKAIIPVHTFGQCAYMDPILDIAKRHNLYVIEDAACAMGSKYKDKFAGTIGDINCFSFHAAKGVCCGEGGMITTNNKELAEKARKLSVFGSELSWKRNSSNTFTIPTFDTLGYNYKLSDISAAIGICQMRKVDRIIQRKRELAKHWNNKLIGLDLIKPPYVSPEYFHNYQGYTTLLDPSIDRDKLIQVMLDKGVQTQIGTYACHTQPIYNTPITCPVSLDLYNRTLRLPMYYELTKQDIDVAAEVLKESLFKCYYDNSKILETKEMKFG